MKLNATVENIFKEAIEDAKIGAAHGDFGAFQALTKFTKFIKDKEVSLADIEWLYRYYKRQRIDLETALDPRLDALRGEVNYMVNYLDSHYEFQELNDMLMVKVKQNG